MDVHRPVGDVLQHRVIGSRKSIGFLYRLVIPVRPIHIVFKQGDGKRMGDFPLHHNVSVCAIRVCISATENICRL